jgi:diketogulonate reductase-like aldo/keto reductase
MFMLTINSKVKLNNDLEMPYFGLGVYLMDPGEETWQAVSIALEAGYRLIDTAAMYGNERDVGLAIKESNILREEVFVTTKLWNSDHGYDRTLRAFDKSLKLLDMDYIDLYLIHWPVEGLRKETWRAMEKIYHNGRCRAIGVSNYTISHLTELLDCADVPPAVNQVEFSPFLYQKDLQDFCNSKNIRLEAYSPLTRTKKFNNSTIQKIAEKYQKSSAQIMIRWALQHEVIVIPKSSNRERIRENALVFDFSISAEDMETLNGLNQNYHVSWDPTHVR